MGLITDETYGNQMDVYCDGDYVGTINVNYGLLPPNVRNNLKKSEEWLKENADPYLLPYGRHCYIHLFEFTAQVQEFAVWCGYTDIEPPENWWERLGDDTIEIPNLKSTSIDAILFDAEE